MSLRNHTHDPRLQAFFLIAPAMAIYAVFALYPMLNVVVLSFQKWNGLDPQRPFVGIANYQYIFAHDPVFWVAFRNTVIWTVMCLVFPPMVGLLLALGLNQKIFGRNALRAIFYLPVIIAPIAVATMWKWMYDPFFGLFSQMLTSMGLQTWIKDWLGDRNIALYSVFVAYLWQSVGFSMVLFLAGLQNVSQTQVEAARIDGAGRGGLDAVLHKRDRRRGEQYAAIGAQRTRQQADARGRHRAEHEHHHDRRPEARPRS